MTNIKLTEFELAYLQAMIWTNCGPDDADEFPEGEDTTISDVAISKAVADCAEFQKVAHKHLHVGTPSQNGHDFWLTRNGHGVGFWDRGYGEVGDALSKIAETFGEVYTYIHESELHTE